MTHFGGNIDKIREINPIPLYYVRLWAECIIVRPCSQAIVALTFSIYATKPFFPECDPPDESVRLLAAVCICE